MFISVAEEITGALIASEEGTVDKIMTTFKDKVLPEVSKHLKGKAKVAASFVKVGFITKSVAECAQKLTYLTKKFEKKMVECSVKQLCKARSSDSVEMDEGKHQQVDVRKLKMDLVECIANTYGETVVAVLQQDLTWVINTALNATVNKAASI